MNIYIEKWILEGVPLNGIDIGENLFSTLDKLKDNHLVLVGTIDSGYYYLPNGFRIGFSNGIIDEVGVDLDYSHSNIIFKDFSCDFDFRDKKIHVVLNFLNDHLIKWKAIESLDLNHLMIIIIEKNIVFIFEIYEGTLSKITKSNLQIKEV